ncbi:MAG: 30S ribosomal protein S6 [Candidatus Peregrinibacteria bacterium GW2011_GWA2_47_7]|nr:MAG: 30S ribosomal protein S6 [Candidatus Peregrinibacteria bacterium GW2011_GWA2_47_7]
MRCSIAFGKVPVLQKFLLLLLELCHQGAGDKISNHNTMPKKTAADDDRDISTGAYELMVIYSPELSEEKWKKEVDELREVLVKETAAIFHESLFGMKPFAYRIKKFLSGYYVVFYFNAEPHVIAEVRNYLKLHLSVVRHLLMTLPEKFDLSVQNKLDEKLTGFLIESRTKKTTQGPRPKQHIMEMKKIEKKKTAEDESATASKEKMLSGHTDEEKLRSVEETLESILQNPDIKV